MDRARVRGPAYLAALTAAAVELSYHVRVYRRDPNRVLHRLTAEELRGGTFDDGGNLLRPQSGSPYRRLFVERADVMAAMDRLAALSPSIADTAQAQEPQEAQEAREEVAS